MEIKFINEMIYSTLP